MPTLGISHIRILSLETTCDETAAAVLESSEPLGDSIPRIVSSVVASQIASHEPFGGVVPEIAAREHVRRLLPVIDEALARAKVGLTDLHAIAVATRPGLVGALVVGLTAAKALAMTLDVPLVAYDHLEGHLYACQLATPERSIYPFVGLVVSGGHTSLYRCRGALDAEWLGGTLDDAAGEAFDKVASILGLGYPGGPSIERAAMSGDRKAHDFPRAMLQDPRAVFSFSGLKTAVLYAVRARDEVSARDTADLAASFQEAVIDVLVEKSRRVLRKTGLRRLGVGGGVAANGRLRERLQALAREEGIEVLIPPISLCTDNAAMGGAAFAKLAAGITSSLDIDVSPGLVRPERR